MSYYTTSLNIFTRAENAPKKWGVWGVRYLK